MNWNGKGKHPVLNKTAEEILAMNDAVTIKHAGTIVDTEEKSPQPSHEQEFAIITADSQAKQEIFIENMANALSTRKY